MRLLLALLLVLLAVGAARAEEEEEVSTGDWQMLDGGAISSSTSPGARVGARAVYCPLIDTMLQFGGFQLNETTGAYAAKADLFAFDFALVNTTTTPSTSNSSSPWIAVPSVVVAGVDVPSPRAWFSMAELPLLHDDDDGEEEEVVCKAVVLGGTNTTHSPLPLADFAWVVRVYANLTAAWELLPSVPPQPPSRFLANAVASKDGTVLLFGGATGGGGNAAGVLRDLWSLNVSSAAKWTLLASTSTSTPARFSHAMAYDAVADTVYVYGGKTYSSSSSSQPSSMVNHVSAFSMQNQSWTVSVAVSQARALSAAFVVNRTLFSFAGMVYRDGGSSFAFNDLAATDLDVAYSSGRCPQFWCTVVDPDTADMAAHPPLSRFDFAHVVRRGELLVVSGGRFLTGLPDVWQLNLTSSSSSVNARKKKDGRITDPLNWWSLVESMYFLIAVLIFLVLCYWVFVHTVTRTFASARHQRMQWEDQIRRAMAAAAAADAPRGVAPEVIRALPLRLVEAPAADADAVAVPEEEAEVCSICLSDFPVGEHVRVLPCQHYFHPPCVDQWLQNRNSCPLCKQPVVAAEPAEPPPPPVVDATSAVAAAAAVPSPPTPAPPPPASDDVQVAPEQPQQQQPARD